MNEYQQNIVQEYCRAILKAERILKEADHDMWNTEMAPLHSISVNLREALWGIHEEMQQAVYTAQEGER